MKILVLDPRVLDTKSELPSETHTGECVNGKSIGNYFFLSVLKILVLEKYFFS